MSDVTEPCLCGDPGCARCGNPPDHRMYESADGCPHPEPADESSDEWDEWADDHPWSSTPDVDRVCLFSPVGEDDQEDDDADA